jgi:hypothetical protein
MRLTYLILNHRPAPQLMHHDRFASQLDAGRLSSLRDAPRYSSNFRIGWGDFSRVDAISECDALDIRRNRMRLGGPSLRPDYPIRPLGELSEVLATTPYDAFVEAIPLAGVSDERSKKERELGYYYQYATMPSNGLRQLPPVQAQLRLRAIARLLADVANRVQPVEHVYKFPEPLPYRMGIRARRKPIYREVTMLVRIALANYEWAGYEHAL